MAGTASPTPAPRRKRRPVQDAPAGPAPSAEAAPADSAPQEDDELKLDMPEPKAAPQPFHPGAPRRSVQPVLGRPVDIGNPFRLLPYAAVVLVAVVLGGVYFLSSGATQKTPRKKSPARSARAAGTSAGAAKQREGKAGKRSGVSGQKQAAASNYKNNAANRKAFFAYQRFMAWAYAQALDWDGARLAKKFKADISVVRVDDPDVLGVYRSSLQIFRDFKSSPLTSVGGRQLKITGPHGRGTFNPAQRRRRWKILSAKRNRYVRAAKERYGLPSDLHKFAAQTDTPVATPQKVIRPPSMAERPGKQGEPAKLVDPAPNAAHEDPAHAGSAPEPKEPKAPALAPGGPQEAPVPAQAGGPKTP